MFDLFDCVGDHGLSVFQSRMWLLLSLTRLLAPKDVCRLQLKRGLFWYRNYPKLHEMVKYRSSRALDWTNRSGISRRVFFNSKKCWKMTIRPKKTQKCCFSWKNLWEATCLTPKMGKQIRYNPLKINNLIIYNQI